MIVFSHPTGNANVRAAVSGLKLEGLLFEFHTSIASFEGDFLNSLGGLKLFSEIRRRTHNSALKSVTKTYPLVETGRLLASKLGLSKLTKHELGLLSVDAVYKNLDKVVAKELKRAYSKGARVIYAYEDGAFASFLEAHHIGLKCFYDLPIGYWRAAKRLLEEEKVRYPEWVPTLSGFKDSYLKLERKDQELKLADKIFVASRFTAQTLKEFPENLAPIEVIPYGFPPVTKNYVPKERIVGEPLKLLFVGGLSQRKGIAHLFEAVQGLKNEVQLTIVGQKAGNDCKVLNTELSKHTWIPSLPHHAILELMKSNDVLVFPSLFEGFGLVITEAMSQGTPVITTDRTAGPDLIIHGKNGWLIDAGSTVALRKAIEELLNSPDKITKAGLEAVETAKSRPWEIYGAELAGSITKSLKLGV